MPKKKKTTRSKTGTVSIRGRSASSRRRSGAATLTLGRYVLPLFLIVIFLGITVYLGIAGFRTATQSSFFDLKAVDIRGTDRTSPDDIKRVVIAAAEKPGVWNADLSDIRAKIEKFPFVKSASVSMLLPDGIRVSVTERIPAAAVRLSYGEYLVDTDGTLLTAVGPKEKDFPIILQGWDESKTEKANPDNLARLKIYRKMLDEWKQFDLASRVKLVDLSNVREPVATVEDSGRAISITLAKENFGKSLKTAIEAVSGKGSRIRSVDAGGVSPVIQYLDPTK